MAKGEPSEDFVQRGSRRVSMSTQPEIVNDEIHISSEMDSSFTKGTSAAQYPIETWNIESIDKPMRTLCRQCLLQLARWNPNFRPQFYPIPLSARSYQESLMLEPRAASPLKRLPTCA
jgi:hypothetical protein